MVTSVRFYYSSIWSLTYLIYNFKNEKVTRNSGSKLGCTKITVNCEAGYICIKVAAGALVCSTVSKSRSSLLFIICLSCGKIMYIRKGEEVWLF
jgi:hypothetical protein